MKNRFDTLLRALFETFGQTPTPGQILGYSMALEDIPIGDLEQAIRRAMVQCKFMPKPVELREMAGVLPLSAKAALAWTAVKKAVHSISAYGSPDFEDPVVNAVIRNMGGWVDFCGRDADTFETFTRRDFERLYMLFAPNGVHLEAGAYLKGITPNEKPKRIPVGYQVEKRREQRLLSDDPLGGIVGVVIDRREEP